MQTSTYLSIWILCIGDWYDINCCSYDLSIIQGVELLSRSITMQQYKILVINATQSKNLVDKIENRYSAIFTKIDAHKSWEESNKFFILKFEFFLDDKYVSVLLSIPFYIPTMWESINSKWKIWFLYLHIVTLECYRTYSSTICL